MFDCILLMAGKGSRTKLNYNKTLYQKKNQPLYMHSLKKFMEIKECVNIIVVTAKEDFKQVSAEINSLVDKRIIVTLGGQTRQESVMQGFKYVKSDILLIHDGARPFIRKEEIIKVYLNTKKYQAAVLAVLVKDTIKVGENGFVKQTLDRKTLYAMQTPQGVNRALFEKCLEEASKVNYLGTDDVELVERFSDVKVKIVPGLDENIKITTPRDLRILELYEGD